MQRIIKSMEEKYLLPALDLVEAVFTAHENAEEGKLVRRLVEEIRAKKYYLPELELIMVNEHDEVIENFKKQPDGSFLISCAADLDDMYDLFQVRGTCDAATVSGWVLEQAGRLPEEGDRFRAEGLDVTVIKVENRRVLEIRVEVLPEEE